MKLYEIDEAITNLIDEETGELTDYEAFEMLQMEKDAKIENLCCWYKDLIAEAKALKEEKQNIAERQRITENKAESIKQFINHVLNGEKFKTAKCAVGYRKSEKAVTDENFIEWAKTYADDLLTYAEPKANLTAIKEAIKGGREIQHVSLENKNNINIK